MRYELLLPADPKTPVDPRRFDAIRSIADLNFWLKQHSMHDIERSAVDAVRQMYPDGLAMPVPVRVGSGTVWLLGIIESIRRQPTDAEDDIPFVLFVRAVPEGERDRDKIKTQAHRIFHREAWKIPVAMPAVILDTVRAELRASDLENPNLVSVVVGVTRGRNVLFLEINGVKMSLTFEKPFAEIGINLRPTPGID